MLLKDLLLFVVDSFQLYVASGECQYETLFKGDKSNIPESFLGRKVKLVGATKSGFLDIELF